MVPFCTARSSSSGGGGSGRRQIEGSPAAPSLAGDAHVPRGSTKAGGCPHSRTAPPPHLEQDLGCEQGGEGELVSVKQAPLRVAEHGVGAGLQQRLQPRLQLLGGQLGGLVLEGASQHRAPPAVVVLVGGAAGAALTHVCEALAGVLQCGLAHHRLARAAGAGLVLRQLQPAALQADAALPAAAAHRAAPRQLHHRIKVAGLLRLAASQVGQRHVVLLRAGGKHRLAPAAWGRIDATLKHVLRQPGNRHVEIGKQLPW